MLSLKINSSFDCLQSRPIFLDHESCFNVFSPDWCFPHRDTQENVFCGKVDSHWFPVDQWVFEVFGSRIHVPRFEIPLVPWLGLALSILADNVLLTRLQTNKQTHNHLFRKTLLSVEGIKMSSRR